MLKVARGDQKAFAVLFDRYSGMVANFAYRFVGDRARAEELTQDIFVKLFKNAKSYRPEAKFKTFLFRVATNHCLNEVRRGEYHVQTQSKDEERESGGELALDAGEAVSPEAALHGKELETAVSLALSEMSERERAAFSMCRFEGMAYREIADALSSSEAAVKSLIHRATLVMTRKIESFKAGELPARSRA